MSLPYERVPMIDVKCPYCGAKEQDVEDLGDHPSYLSGTCGECGRDFSVDVYREEYYDGIGKLIK